MSNQTGTHAFLSSAFGNKPEELEEVVNVEDTVEEEVITDTETVEDEVVEQEETTEDTEQESVEEVDNFYAFSEDTEPVQQEQVQHTEPSQEEPEVFDVKEYLKTNSDKVKDYLQFISMDMDNMSNEELITLKLKREHPNWSAQDIKDELEEQYGIGLKLKTIPEDAFDDERARIEKENESIQRQINRGDRLLKSEISKVKQEFAETQASLELPTIELGKKANKEEVIQEYVASAQKQQEEFYETTWIPQIKEGVAKLSGIKEKLEFDLKDGEKGQSDLTYRLTEKQKSELVDYLSSYQAHSRDQKYIKGDGSLDMDRFLADKTRELFAIDIAKQHAKQAIIQFKEAFAKDLVNYQDEPRKNKAVPQGTAQKDFARSHFEASANSRQR